MLMHCPQNGLDLSRTEQRRGTSTEVDCTGAEASKPLSSALDLLAEGKYVVWNIILKSSVRIEVAVRATRFAEWYVDIQGDAICLLAIGGHTRIVQRPEARCN